MRAIQLVPALWTAIIVAACAVEVPAQGAPVRRPSRLTKPKQDPLQPTPGTALSHRALVTDPAPLPGVLSWTIESRRHRGAMFCFWPSPDGRFLATGGIDGTVRVWDLQSGQLVRVMVGHDYYSYGVSWSPDGKVLASAGSFDGTIRLWDASTGKPTRVFDKLRSYVHHVAWSPDGAKLAAAGSQSGWIWLCSGAGEGRDVLEVGQEVFWIGWAPDSVQLAVCARSSSISILDMSAGRLSRTLGKADDVFTCAAWSPDGKTLAAGSATGVTLWNVADEKPGKTLKTPCASVAWSPDGKQLAIASTAGVVRLWDPDADKPGSPLPGAATRLIWHPGTKQVFGSSSLALTAWDPAEKKQLRSIDAAGMTPPVYEPNRPAITGLGTPTLQLWNASTTRFLHSLKGHTAAVSAVSWSRDGKTLASAGSDKTVRLWEARSGELLATLDGHTAAVSAVAWSPDGKRLASGGPDNTVRLWDEGGKSLGALEGHGGAVTALCWSPASNQLASGGADRTIILWDPDTLQQIRSIPSGQTVECLAWTTSGRTPAIACGTLDDGVRIYHATTGKSLALLSQPGSPPNVSALCWLPGATMLLAGRGNHTVQLWDLHSDKPLQDLRTVAGVRYVTWTTSGLVLVAGADDRTTRFWDARTAAVLGTLLAEDGYLAAISADGHWRVDPDKKPDFFYVVQTPSGQSMLPPDEFARQCRWKNTPSRVQFAGRN